MLLVAPSAAAQPSPDPLPRYAEDTWASFVAMTDAQSGLPADALNADGSTSVQTSTTNIGAYMWSALVAERLRIIGHRETVVRLRRTLATLERMERHEPSGQFYNWYDHRTGAKLTTWPPTGDTIEPILSSVDNGWLAVGLRVVASRVPELRGRAQELFDSMDFGFYYRPEVNRILFHYVPDTAPRTAATTRRLGEPDRRPTSGSRRARSRSASTTALAVVPRLLRPGRWAETRPQSASRAATSASSVFEGAYPYNGTRVTPSWGGSMFEALMPALFVPEERWGPGSWGANHPLFVRTQMHHGLVDAEYGYWGFSPANTPEGGYAGLRRRRDRHGPERLPVQRGQHPRRPRLRRLPRIGRRSPTRRRPRTPTAW